MVLVCNDHFKFHICYHSNKKILHLPINFVIKIQYTITLHQCLAFGSKNSEYDVASLNVRNDIMTTFCVNKWLQMTHQWLQPKLGLLIIKVPRHFPQIPWTPSPESITKLTLNEPAKRDFNFKIQWELEFSGKCAQTAMTHTRTDGLQDRYVLQFVISTLTISQWAAVCTTVQQVLQEHITQLSFPLKACSHVWVSVNVQV